MPVTVTLVVNDACERLGSVAEKLPIEAFDFGARQKPVDLLPQELEAGNQTLSGNEKCGHRTPASGDPKYVRSTALFRGPPDRAAPPSVASVLRRRDG